MDRIEVERGRAGAVGDHGHRGALGQEQGEERRLHLVDHRTHVADGAIAEEGHRAMGDAPLGLDFRPPDAAMAKADPVLVERFGDDDVLHAGRVEPAALGEVGDAAVTAGFLVRGGGDLDGSGEIGVGGREGLGGDDGGGEPALHVAGAAPPDAALVQLAPERIAGPAVAHGHDVMVAVEVKAIAGARAFEPADDVPAGMPVAVSGGPFGANVIDLPALRRHPGPDEVADVAVVQARGIERGDSDEPLRQVHQRVAAALDLAEQSVHRRLPGRHVCAGPGRA